ncbi:MAG: hypothetical protein HY042_11190 [Spirochaetia bacterium]|nr:hypothetical protein [Spirochaetia bacterium]
MLTLYELSPETLQDLAHIRKLVLQAVEDNLRTVTNPAVDILGAAREIERFIFSDVSQRIAGQDDATRYDTYYSLLGKGVAVAQGWKQNCAAAVKVGQTIESLREYVQKTYGRSTGGG